MLVYQRVMMFNSDNVWSSMIVYGNLWFSMGFLYGFRVIIYDSMILYGWAVITMGCYLIFPQAEASKLTWRFRLKASPSYRWMIAPRTENYWLLCCSITMKFATLSLLFSFFLYVSLCTQFPSLVFGLFGATLIWMSKVLDSGTKKWITWALWNDSMNVWFEDWSSDIPGYLAKNRGVAEAIARGMWF